MAPWFSMSNRSACAFRRASPSGLRRIHRRVAKMVNAVLDQKVREIRVEAAAAGIQRQRDDSVRAIRR